MELTLKRIYQARKHLQGIACTTPLTLSHELSRISGAKVYLKWENLQKTGSFKLRGAVHKMLSLDRNKLTGGVITASAGNHGQGVAYGAALLGIPATVMMPVSTPQVKVENTQRLGATVILFGDDYDQAHARCMELVAETGMTYIPAFEDHEVMAGQGTLFLEILEDLPEIDMVLVPIGGGGLISGIGVAAKTIDPKIQVIGVQTTQACTMYHCFRAGKMVSVPVLPTLAEGLAGGIEEISLEVVLKTVDHIILTPEEHLGEAIAWVLAQERQVVEASGVVGVATILQNHIPGLKDKNIAVVISGGNIDKTVLKGIVSAAPNNPAF